MRRHPRPHVVIRHLLVLAAVCGALVAPPAPAGAADDRARIVVTYTTPWPSAAKAAFEYAVARWETMIYSPVTIRVSARWSSQGTGALGNASPTSARTGFGVPGRARDDTWYSAALGDALAGYDMDPGQADIEADFNRDLDNWDFGTDGRPGRGKFDFVTIVMHELGHGLGFGGFMGVDGDGNGYWSSPDDASYPPGIFDRFTANRRGRMLLSYEHGSAALGDVLTSNHVYWAGARATAYNGDQRPRLFAPRSWQPGTSYQHLDERTYAPGTRDELMTPFGSVEEVSHNPGPLALGMMQDMGWQLGARGRAIVRRTTILRVRVSDTSIRAGDAFAVTGRLRRATDGAALSGKTVHILRRARGTTTWREIATRSTDAAGNVTLRQSPSDDMQYQLRHPGSRTTDGDRSGITAVAIT